MLAGLTTLGASYASPVPKWLLKNYGKDLIGEDIDLSKLPKSFSELYYRNVLGERAADMGFFEVRKSTSIFTPRWLALLQRYAEISR